MFTTRPEIKGTFGVVASTHWLASAVGMSILERGGNAFDAAVATGFTLQVVEPHLNGPAGEAPILLWSQAEERIRVICGQGVAPQAATIRAFRDLDLDLVPGTGLLAACVPGAFDAWLTMLRDYGTMRLADVLAPAISYAEGGYPLVPRITAAIETVRDLFATEWPTSAAIYLPRGQVPAAESLFRNPGLAATYRRVLGEAAAAGSGREAQIEAARSAWSHGFVAEAIDRFCRTERVLDASGRRHGGLLTADDMARWQAGYEEPLTFDYHGFTVAKPGIWSQGAVFLQQLALLEGFDLSAMDPLGDTFVHTVTECAKLALADREAWYGDPDFVDVPVAALLDRGYAAERRRLVGDTASHELRPGAPAGRRPRYPEIFARLTEMQGSFVAGAGEPTTGGGIGEPTVRRDGEPRIAANGAMAGDTCHVDVIDRWGNMVAVTPSGGWLQSSPAIPELGFALGTRAQMFWLEEGLPASLAPGKRPRSTLSPSMALKDGKPYLAFGTPGGDQQDQWSALLFLHRVHHGLNLQESIDVPAFHTEHVPSSFYPRQANLGLLAVESRFPDATLRRLRERGHRVQVGDPWSEGRLSACSQETGPDGTLLRAAANPRGMQGYAVGR